MIVFVAKTLDPYLGFDVLQPSTMTTSHEATARLANMLGTTYMVIKVNVPESSRFYSIIQTNAHK
jgi:hypothetical protein